MGFLELLTIGFTLVVFISMMIIFILFVVYMNRKEKAAVKQFGRIVDEEVSHGRI